MNSNARRMPRQSPREAVSWPVAWVGGNDDPQQGLICDFSAEGMFIRPLVGSSLPESPAGTRLQLRVHPPGYREPLLVGGTIRWSGFQPRHRRDGVGVELDSTLQIDLQRLRRSRAKKR